MRRTFLFLLCLNFACVFAEAQEKPRDEQPPVKKDLKEESSETSHSVVINGVEIKYKAVAGTMLLKDDKDNNKASIFYIAYTKEGGDAKRPITYCFNGGPGSSSVWLHLGVFGPRRVQIAKEGEVPPPYQLIDNDFSLLDLTDLVFIDPVSTGYSRAAPGEDVKQFHGVEEDVKWVAEFIRLYTTRARRWDSPKFIAGESYGTTRAASLAGYLHDDMNFYLNGVILVSSVLNFQTIDDESDLGAMLFLPSYTATAWYHKKLAPELQKDLPATLREVQAFVNTEYVLALMKGDQIDDKTRQNISAKLSRYTSLPVSYIERSNLRLCEKRFVKQLLREEKRVVGRFDSRYTGIDLNPCNDTSQEDPSAEAIFGLFTATFNQYVRNELKWEKDEQYKILANVWPWNFGKDATNKYLDVATTLSTVMSKNPYLRVFVGSGYYDLATPYYATDYTFNHLGLDPSLRDHVQMEYYEAGHMMYLHRPSLIKMKKDLVKFIHTALENK